MCRVNVMFAVSVLTMCIHLLCICGMSVVYTSCVVYSGSIVCIMHAEDVICVCVIL